MCVFDGTYYKIKTTNYISKTSLYHILHVSVRTLATECLMFTLLVTREIATYSWPWEKTRDGKYTPTLFSVRLWLLLIVIANATQTGIWTHVYPHCSQQEYEHTFGHIVPYDDLCFNDTLTQSLDNQYLGPGHAFIRQQHMCRGGYLFLLGFFSMYDAIHGWMTRRMDGWKKLHDKRPRRPLLYVMFSFSLLLRAIGSTSKVHLVLVWLKPS